MGRGRGNKPVPGNQKNKLKDYKDAWRKKSYKVSVGWYQPFRSRLELPQGRKAVPCVIISVCVCWS